MPVRDPRALWVTQYYSSRLRPGYLRNRELYDSLVELFSESIRGVQTIKGFAAEPLQVRRFEAANVEVSSQQRRIFSICPSSLPRPNSCPS